MSLVVAAGAASTHTGELTTKTLCAMKTFGIVCVLITALGVVYSRIAVLW